MRGLIARYLEIVRNLSPKEIIILVIVTAAFLLYFVWHKLGKGAAVALVIIYFLIYVIYSNNLYDYYNSQTADTASRLQQIEAELRK